MQQLGQPRSRSPSPEEAPTPALQEQQASLADAAGGRTSTHDELVASGAASVKLHSGDGQVFEVDLQAARLCGTLRTIMEGLGNAGAVSDDVIIPLVNVSSAVLERVLEWVEVHKRGLQQPAASAQTTSWDAEFFDVDLATLFHIIQAADYLDIKELAKAGCKTVANLIRSQTTDDMRRRPRLRSDLTPAQEQLVRRQTEWFK